MSPPQLGVEDQTQENISQSNFSLKERNYLGLTNCSSKHLTQLEDNKNNLNLKATELRLGLPGSQSPERVTKREEIALFPFLPLKDGNYAPAHKRSCPASEVKGSNNNTNAPAAKAQVVGWPPIRSFRKNTLATTSKNNEEVDGKPGPGTLFVKVSMDGAPYLRKVDLKLYSNYPELSSALEKMFTCFTIGQCGSQGAAGNDKLSESKLSDLLTGSEYVLAYEDKDGDWMRVGDVPWEMFIETCKRLKIMKSSDAIGLAPRAAEKSNKA